MSSLDQFNILLERMETLDEMADSFKRTVKGAAGGEDGLNIMLKAYRNERTGKPVGAVSRIKNLIVLRALYDKDYINDEQFQSLTKKATSSNYISNTLKEINPEAHRRLFGSKQESDEIINHIKLNAKDMLNFGLTNLQGKNYVEAPVEDTPEDPDAEELEDEVTGEVVALAKGLTSKDLEGTILDFDDVDVTLQGLDNQDDITRKLLSVLNGAGYTAEATPAGFNVEAPIGSFGTEEEVKDLMTGLILKYFPGVSESGIGVLLNTTVEDAESFNEKPDLEGEIDPSRDPRTTGEALNDARDERDEEDAAMERFNATNPVEDAEVSVKAEVLAACKQRAVELAGPEAVTTNAGMAVGCESMYNEYGKDGEQVKAEIAFNQHHYFDEQAKGGFEKTPYKVEAAEDAEGMENKYTVIENDEEGSIQPMEYRQPEGDLIKTVKSDGIVKKCYQHPEGREWTVESDKVIDFDQEGSWTWDEESNVEDAEEAGFNHKQLDELEDIVHAILDKRDHEDRASKHEDGEY